MCNPFLYGKKESNSRFICVQKSHVVKAAHGKVLETTVFLGWIGPAGQWKLV